LSTPQIDLLEKKLESRLHACRPDSIDLVDPAAAGRKVRCRRARAAAAAGRLLRPHPTP
jgi:hypothetical protein